MAKKKSSCLKRLAIGCGAFVLLFVLLGFAIFISASLNKPKPADRQKLAVSESFGGNPETSMNLPEGAPPSKPVRLELDLSMLDFDLEPHSSSKSIEIEGDYDKANFDLETKVVEHDDYVSYKVSFKNKRSLLGMILSKGGVDDRDINNRVVLRVPRDLLLDIRFKMSMGDADLDFSGLAVSDLKAEFSMGEFTVRMEEPNQVAMNQFKVSTGMGESQIYDFQNLRMAKGDVRSSMGQVEIRNSGDLIEPASLRLKMTMGELRLDAPPNANLNTNSTVLMGESRGGDRKSEQGTGPELEVNANVTMGSVNVNRTYSRSPLRGRMLRIISEQGIDAAIADYKELWANRKAFYDFRPRSLNSIGYALLRREQYQDAIAVFKLNVEMYPNYANGYDSLGEAYMKTGQREDAIRNYEKAIEMDPSSENAMAMLAILKQNGTDDPPKEPETPDPPDPN